MHNLIRFYNQNRKKIWNVIVIIIFALIMIRLLNYLTILNNQKNSNVSGSLNIVQSEKKEKINNKATSNKSMVNGKNISNKQLESTQIILDRFIDNCNSQNLEGAYNLLTDECKETVYPTLESFKNNYYNNMFEGEKKIYSFANWYNNTYYVTLKDDILATGKINASENAKSDYITIIRDKLNIRSFIGIYELGNEKSEKNITINVKSKQTFMDYEIYNLNVKNDSDKTICLTLGEDSKDIYIQDKNNVKYGVANNEIVNSNMYINPGTSRNLSLKFYSSYVADKQIQKIVFKKLNLDANNVEQNNIYEYRIDL